MKSEVKEESGKTLKCRCACRPGLPICSGMKKGHSDTVLCSDGGGVSSSPFLLESRSGTTILSLFLSQLLFHYSLPQCLIHFSSTVCACTLEPGVSRSTGWVISTKQMSEQIFLPLKAFQQVLISEQPIVLSPAWSGIFPLHPSVTRPL